MDTKSYNRAKAILDEFTSQDIKDPKLTERFRRWLSDDRHAASEKDAALEQLYEKQMDFDEHPDRAVHQDYEQLRSLLGLAEATGEVPVRPPTDTAAEVKAVRAPWRRTLLRIAAVIVPALVLAGGGWLFYQRSTPTHDDLSTQLSAFLTPHPVDIHLEAPQDTAMSLPDGSYVYVRQLSSLTYSDNFEKNRSLTLIGEANFKVNKRKGASPFTVNTESGISIVATGTEFKVQDYNHARYTVVWLYEGSVDIRRRDATYPLTAGQQLIFDKQLDRINVKQILLATPTATSDVVSFPYTPLREILRWAGQYYGVIINFPSDNPAVDITSEPINAKFTRTDSLEEVLLRLEIITGSFRHTITKDAEGLLHVNIIPIEE
ncbi:MAG: FecR domain-containing protein [Prevotellaceae bacterium]|jgi:ferric-dicitrate binding protein FerR (iron transport regulator)|nr:FecR domain-containing protein [Prevotellaceae bacterium]